MLEILTYEEFYQQLSEFLSVEIVSEDWKIRQFILEGVEFGIDIDPSFRNDLSQCFYILYFEDDSGDIVCEIPTYYGHILKAAAKGEEIIKLDSYKGADLVVVDIDQVAKNLYDFLRNRSVLQNIKNAL